MGSIGRKGPIDRQVVETALFGFVVERGEIESLLIAGEPEDRVAAMHRQFS